MKLVVEILLVFVMVFKETNSAEQQATVDSGNIRFSCWNRRGQIAHPIYCDWFYNCWDGATYEQQCPQELAFNPSIQACDYPVNVDCGFRILSWAHARDFRCPKVHGVFPDPSRGCSAFVVCDRGASVEFVCPETLHFNQATSVCDYPYKVWPVCNDDDSPNIPTTYDFFCPRANGIFVHKDCDKFWVCDNYRSTVMTCAKMTLYDSRYVQCVDWRYAQCSNYEYQLPVNFKSKAEIVDRQVNNTTTEEREPTLQKSNEK